MLVLGNMVLALILLVPIPGTGTGISNSMYVMEAFRLEETFRIRAIVPNDSRSGFQCLQQTGKVTVAATQSRWRTSLTLRTRFKFLDDGFVPQTEE